MRAEARRDLSGFQTACCRMVKEILHATASGSDAYGHLRLSYDCQRPGSCGSFSVCLAWSGIFHPSVAAPPGEGLVFRDKARYHLRSRSFGEDSEPDVLMHADPEISALILRPQSGAAQNQLRHMKFAVDPVVSISHQGCDRLDESPRHR